MSTLTSLVKSGKRKIIKTKAGEPVERERDGIKAQQKPPERAGSGASRRGFLGRPIREYREGF